MGPKTHPESIHPARVRVGIVAEDALARAGLAAALAADPGLEIVFQLAPGEAEGEPEGRADVLLWDLGARGAEGELRPVHRGDRTLALVARAELAPAVLELGPVGVLLRDASPAQIAVGLRATARGLVVFDAPAASAALPRPAASDLTAVETLTPRELEVLELLAQGLSNKEIARRLGISEHTAKFHVNSILAKLGVQGRTEAVVRAARLGLVVL